MFNLGPLEVVAIATAVLLIFGPKRLPELAKGMGKGIRDFKKALSGADDDPKEVVSSEPSSQLKSGEQKTEKDTEKETIKN